MLADARGFYQSLLGCLIDKRFRGNVAGFTRAPRQAPGALFLSAERPNEIRKVSTRSGKSHELIIYLLLFFNYLRVIYRVTSAERMRAIVGRIQCEPATAKLSAAPFPNARLVVKMTKINGQWGHEMQRVFLTIMVCLTLAACGLGETAISAAAGGASEAAQAKEALRIEARVKQQLDATATLEAQRRQAADASSQ
jgi:hypothetical protein